LKQPSALTDLVEALRVLPGVGPRSAQRMAYYLLQRERGGAARLGHSLERALQTIVRCRRCNGFSDTPVCDLCESPQRTAEQLCVVETPADLLMIEQTLAYRGLYFVLMGPLSPLDGIGPKDVGLDMLMQRASDATVKEVVLATNFTNEGEATAHYIGEMLQARGIKVSRIARGVPVGGELEHVDSGTLAQAVLDRRPV